ncbi:MAG: NUDIX domain-containing protein [Fuerstiella sp.]|nr:NUDIX domain-containing protein [Fuerstiella sp.]
MKQPRSCGFLIVTGEPIESFLLMEHKDRWDLPKGHVDPGESDLECALRELEEETGFDQQGLQIDHRFCYEQRYHVSGKRYGHGKRKSEQLEKTLRIFLAAIAEPLEPKITEHIGFRWFAWKPPHRIQERTIDPLLAQLEIHLKTNSGAKP